MPDGYTPWSKTFTVSAICPDTLPSTVAGASFVMPDCLGNPGRVSLTNEGGVIWTLTRGVAVEVVAGNSSYDVTPGAAVELTAQLEGPEGSWTWNDPQQQMLWNQAFPAADDDCLPTLAFTGASLRNTRLIETEALPSQRVDRTVQIGFSGGDLYVKRYSRLGTPDFRPLS